MYELYLRKFTICSFLCGKKAASSHLIEKFFRRSSNSMHAVALMIKKSNKSLFSYFWVPQKNLYFCVGVGLCLAVDALFQMTFQLAESKSIYIKCRIVYLIYDEMNIIWQHIHTHKYLFIINHCLFIKDWFHCNKAPYISKKYIL